jgi:hypothetical protein
MWGVGGDPRSGKNSFLPALTQPARTTPAPRHFAKTLSLTHDQGVRILGAPNDRSAFVDKTSTSRECFNALRVLPRILPRARHTTTTTLPREKKQKMSSPLLLPELRAAEYMSYLLSPLLLHLSESLALHQPDRPSAFIKAFALERPYEGEMRGEAHFNPEAAGMYMKILAGPVVGELVERLLSLAPEARPPTRAALNAWIAANIDSIGAKVDAASVRIASSVRGMAARKRVSRMRTDPHIRDRADKAKASDAYASGGVTGKQHRRQAARAAAVAAASPAGASAAALGADTNESQVGRGVESQVAVDADAFEAYVREQAEQQKRAEEEAKAAADAAEAAAAEAAAAAAAAAGEAGGEAAEGAGAAAEAPAVVAAAAPAPEPEAAAPATEEPAAPAPAAETTEAAPETAA